MTYRTIGVLALLFLISPLSFAEESKPAWWDAVEIQIVRKSGSGAQYEDVFNSLLTPAYAASGETRELLLKKSIKAFTQLIDWFPGKDNAAVTAASQYQIAEAYRQLHDAGGARRSYEKCLDYRQYAADPPQNEADIEILATVEQAQKDLTRPV